MQEKKRISKPTKEAIAQYWQQNNTIDEMYLNFDWEDALIVCWNCGLETDRTQRCHIIPEMLGGDGHPKNFVLLCDCCHGEAPNYSDPSVMWKWIKSNKLKISLYSSGYRFQKAVDQFERENAVEFLSIVIALTRGGFIPWKGVLQKYLDKIGLHKHYVTESSYYYMIQEMYNDCDFNWEKEKA